MTPESIASPATSDQVEASAEVSLAAAAVTLETLQAAIETESEVSQERQAELLQEVRECRTRLETLSASMVQVESPSIQQMLLQMGEMQTSLQTIQADLTALMEEQNGSEESPEESSTETPADLSATSTKPGSKQEGNGREKNGPQSNGGNRPESSPLPEPIPAPKKKRYVKI